MGSPAITITPDSAPVTITPDAANDQFAGQTMRAAPSMLEKMGSYAINAIRHPISSMLNPAEIAMGAGKIALGPAESSQTQVPGTGVTVGQVTQRGEDLAGLVGKEESLLLAPEAAEAGLNMVKSVPDAIESMRAARAARLVKDTGEWQRINDVLNVPKPGVIVSPSTATVEGAVKMPGRTVAEMGYSADELQKMEPMTRMNVLNSHLQNVGANIESAAQAATKAGKTIDLGDLDGSVLGVFKQIKNPEMKGKMIDQFYESAKDLGISDFRSVTPEQALALRQSLRAGKSFSGFSDIQTTSNISKQLGSAVSNELKGAVPEFVDLDRQYTDLKGAVTAAKGQVQMSLKNAPPPSLLSRMATGAKNEIMQHPIRTAAYAAGGTSGVGLLIERILHGGGKGP